MVTVETSRHRHAWGIHDQSPKPRVQSPDLDYWHEPSIIQIDSSSVYHRVKVKIRFGDWIKSSQSPHTPDIRSPVHHYRRALDTYKNDQDVRDAQDAHIPILYYYNTIMNVDVPDHVSTTFVGFKFSWCSNSTAEPSSDCNPIK
jgi:hypothetical protein